MEAFGRNIKAIPLKHQPAHVKFIHNQLPLGDRLFQRSAVKDENLKRCPRCKTAHEDIHHFLHCSQNTNRTKSITAMLKTMLKDSHPSNPALASSIEQYLLNPGNPISYRNDNFPSSMDETLQRAIEEQTLIGWHQLLWRRLASMDPTNKETENLQAGQRKLHTVLTAAMTLMIWELWIGRRHEVLHAQKGRGQR